jgi:glycerol-3-phosphate acyltransferase PlsY
LTLVLDATKGALAVWLARSLLTPNFGINWWVAGAAIIAIFGHCFPVWLGFRGGKGVATGVGVFLSLSPLALAYASIVFVLVVATTHYVSLASITAAAAFPFCVSLATIFARPSRAFAPVMTAALIGAALIIFMHRANIGRLMHGTESKFR